MTTKKSQPAQMGLFVGHSTATGPRLSPGETPHRLRLATWNVNSLRARLSSVLDWIRERKPDVLCLQETRVADADVPFEGFAHLGYDIHPCGLDGANGVAIVTRAVVTDVVRGFRSGFARDEGRIISASVFGIRVVCVYVPNAKDAADPSFEHKLQWLVELRRELERLGANEELAVLGDFNVAPAASDVGDVDRSLADTFVDPRVRAAFADLASSGVRHVVQHDMDSEVPTYTWWDYRGGLRTRRGMRIDHVLLSGRLADGVRQCESDQRVRDWSRPSDHVPVIVEIELTKTS